MKKLLKQSITILFIMSSIFIESVNAQPGFLDLPFGNNGVTAIQYSGYGYSKIIELSNQKISGVCNGFLYDRYNSDGTPDESFGNNGRIYLPSGNISSNTVGVAELLNGDVVIGGWYALSSVQINILLIKCKSDGSIDSSFGKNGMATMDIDKRDYAEAMVLQPDGKIIISGDLLFIVKQQSNKRILSPPLNALQDLSQSSFVNKKRLSRILISCSCNAETLNRWACS